MEAVGSVAIDAEGRRQRGSSGRVGTTAIEAQESVMDIDSGRTPRQLPLLGLVQVDDVASDTEVQRALAEMHCTAAENMRADADTLNRSFPGNALADREAESLRADATLLLRSARALAEHGQFELRPPLHLTG